MLFMKEGNHDEMEKKYADFDGHHAAAFGNSQFL